MSVSIIALFIILFGLISITFLGIKAVIIVLNKKIRMNAEKGLTFYDEVFERRKRTIERLEKQKEDALNIPNVEIIKPNIGNGIRAVNEKGQSNYYNEKFIMRYQNIKSRYMVDKFDIVKTVVDKVANGQKNKSMQTKISSDNVYALSTLKSNKQIDILHQTLTKEDVKYLDKYLENYKKNDSNFSIIEFMEYIKNEDERNNDVIKIITSDKTDDFSNFGDNVVTVYDNELCEGIEIIAGNKFYNLGIRKREIIGGRCD